jgi:ABC-type transport system substrate-binding protein
LGYAYVLWNRKAASRLVADPELRRAIAQAIDMDSILQNDFNGVLLPFRGIWGGRPNWEGDRFKPFGYDKNAAVAALERIGWHAAKGERVRKRGGVDLKILVLVGDKDVIAQRVLSRIQPYLAAVQVELTVQAVPDDAMKKAFAADECDGYVKAVIPNANPAQDRVRWARVGSEIDRQRNDSGFDNADVTDLFERARQESDVEQRHGLFQAIQKRIYEEQPYLFLWQHPLLMGYSGRLRGVEFSPLGSDRFYPGVRGWWVAAGE